jgi:type II secretory pathway pseudopilin PulG
MQTKYRAMTLIEILTVIAVFAMLLVPIASVARSLVKGIPNSYNIYQTNESVLNAIAALKYDIARAEKITLADGPEKKIQLSNSYGTIDYTFSENTLSMRQDDKLQQWELPNAKFDLKVYEVDSNTSAVEIGSYISVKNAGKDAKKLSNNYLFFTGLIKNDKGYLH